MNPLVFLGLVFKASLFSTGGLGNVPSLHADLVSRAWTTDKQFAEAIAVGQISPGPNGLWAVSLGYLMGGTRYALLALLAILVPPLLVLLVEKLYRHVKHHPVVEGFVRGLSLAVVGIFVIVAIRLLGAVGINVRTVGIVIGSICLALTGRVPVVAVLALGAGAGLLLNSL